MKNMAIRSCILSSNIGLGDKGSCCDPLMQSQLPGKQYLFRYNQNCICMHVPTSMSIHVNVHRPYSLSPVRFHQHGNEVWEILPLIVSFSHNHKAFYSCKHKEIICLVL